MISADELKNFRLLEELNERELEQVARLAKEETREKGSRIIAEKALATNLYLVKEGKVTVRMRDKQGEELIIDEIGPGKTFGWSAIAHPKSFTAAVYAEMPTQLIVLNGDHLRQLMEANNHIGYRIMLGIARVITRRLERCRMAYMGHADNLRRP